MAETTGNSARTYFNEMRALLDRVDCGAIDRFAELLFEAWRGRHRVFAFGNGGSASTAGHFVCDLVKTVRVQGQPRLDVAALGDNPGLLTALANDDSYDDIFVFPLSSFAREGDLAIAISCSGNSPNVVRACRWARENRLRVVALTGTSGGKLAGLADLHVNIPHQNFGIIEDLHLSIGHIVSQVLKQRIEAHATEAIECKS